MPDDRTKKLLFCLYLFVVTVDVNGFSVKYDYVSATNLTRNTRQAKNCRSDQFQCLSGQCISEDDQCDGVSNCEDKSDETETCQNKYCPGFAFKCEYGGCIDKFRRCDGKKDCHDNSDEVDCPINGHNELGKIQSNCKSDQFQCKSGQCISQDDKCDGIYHCKDKSDETKATCLNNYCPGFAFKCDYGACIDKFRRCNGKKDCHDDSDELDCTSSSKPTMKPTVKPTKPTDKPTKPTSGPTKPTQVPETTVGCVLPKHPLNGKWEIKGISTDGLGPGKKVAFSTVLQFSCEEKYQLSEKGFVFCDQEGWSMNPLPTCMVKCPAMYTTHTTILHCFDERRNEIPCTQAVDGAIAKFECAPYYEPTEHTYTTRYCWKGIWNLPQPKCIPVCGEKTVSAVPLIVNGQNVSKGEYPWTVAIFQKSGQTFTNVCGGSMLSQKVVLTAGHCVTNDHGDALDPAIIKVGVGKYYNNYEDPRDSQAQYSDVEAVIKHVKFKGSDRRYENDIAFLITTDTLLLSKVVQPVCYSNLQQFYLNSNSVGVVTGWGYTVSDGIPSGELKAVEVPYKDDATCNQELPTEWADKYMTYDKFCAGYNNRSIAVCKGDSGGGLAFKNPKDQRYYVHGIVSVAHKVNGGCDIELSSLYTRVATHYDWLEQVTSQHAIPNN